ncbi:radial spoke head protein 3 homolog [Coccinella septempunctata]|uniref:radial spoke head protein 3 homolog n=1 Tax=Coccinella septempunctata TaxID=41139 RepID=UPI001D0689CE|nr:radial spoke head protein 3 homolog [Coccinella septempunctata]
MDISTRQLSIKKPKAGRKTIIAFTHEEDEIETEEPPQVYTFSSSPRALYTNRKLIAGQDVPLPYANLMFERRVVRGSNYAQPPLPHLGDGESAAARAAVARRRAMARKKARTQNVKAAELRLGSPPAIKGRKHEPVQTDQFLEEIFITPPVTEMCTQTELFLDRPVSPFYVPAKTGIDAETQIYPGDLFDFDMEVQPILEVLVGKTVEQALIEVLEEEELAALKEQQRKFLEIRAAEACEAQRLIEKERRLQREKERRIKDYEEGIKVQKEMEERIAASVLMQGYLADLLPSVLEGLESEGVLLDNIKQDIDNTFMPWLMKEVTNELEDIVSSRDILSDIVRDILENKAEIYNAIYSMFDIEEPKDEAPQADFYDTQELSKLIYDEKTKNEAPESVVRISEEPKEEN